MVEGGEEEKVGGAWLLLSEEEDGGVEPLSRMLPSIRLLFLDR